MEATSPRRSKTDSSANMLNYRVRFDTNHIIGSVGDETLKWAKNRVCQQPSMNNQRRFDISREMLKFHCTPSNGEQLIALGVGNYRYNKHENSHQEVI